MSSHFDKNTIYNESHNNSLYFYQNVEFEKLSSWPKQSELVNIGCLIPYLVFITPINGA